MSHITQVTTSMTDLSVVARALQLMEVPFKADPKGLTVRMWGGRNLKAPIVINQKSYDVGINLENGKAKLQADSYAWNELFHSPKVSKMAAKQRASVESFAGVLQQAYNIVKVKEEAEARGDQFLMTEPDANGVINCRIVTA